MYCILIKSVEDVDAVYITRSWKGLDPKRFKETIQTGSVTSRIQETGTLESLNINTIKHGNFYKY